MWVSQKSHCIHEEVSATPCLSCDATHLCLESQSLPRFLEPQDSAGAVVPGVSIDLKDRAALRFYRKFKQWEC